MPNVTQLGQNRENFVLARTRLPADTFQAFWNTCLRTRGRCDMVGWPDRLEVSWRLDCPQAPWPEPR